MWESYSVLVVEPLFWLRVIGGLAIWYALACGFSRKLLEAGIEPLRAARNGAFLALMLSAPGVCIGAWAWWRSVPLALVLAFTTFFLPLGLLITLVRLEPKLENE
jgi:hypothetical protein